MRRKLKEVEAELIDLEREIGFKRDNKKQEETKVETNQTPGLLVSNN